ncbi:MAG: CpXC domain-containing protein [Clostridiales bacterium]|nr:CpXC domain-containing protein [Clostridiales bacterium]
MEEKQNKKIDLLPREEERYKPVEAKVHCRFCGKTSVMKLRACVNVSLHPEEKELVLNGSFFQYECPSCKEKLQVVYPCLYDDMSRALMIYLLPDETEKALAELNSQQHTWSPEMLKAAMVCTMRAVRTPNDLCEKIKIADAELDDRYVELTKAFVFAQFMKQKPDFKAAQVLYERQNGKDGFVMISKEGKTFWAQFPDGLYDEVVRMFSDRIPKKKTTDYELIDANWTANILSKLKE